VSSRATRPLLYIVVVLVVVVQLRRWRWSPTSSRYARKSKRWMKYSYFPSSKRATQTPPFSSPPPPPLPFFWRPRFSIARVCAYKSSLESSVYRPARVSTRCGTGSARVSCVPIIIIWSTNPGAKWSIL